VRWTSSQLRDGTWATPLRLAAIGFALTVASVAQLVRLAPTGTPRLERVGYDFYTFWTVGTALRRGLPEIVYSPEALRQFQVALFGPFEGSVFITYPPTALLVFYPLAWAPFPLAMAGSVLVGLALYLTALRRIGVPALVAALFPVWSIGILYGNPSFLIAALYGWALALLPSRPFVAGVLFGVLTFKPHLGLLVPVALVAGRQWRALASASISSVGLAALSTLAFGTEVWTGYLSSFGTAGHVLQSWMSLGKFQSVFGAAGRLGATFGVAIGLHALVAVAGAVAVARVWGSEADHELKAALLLAGSLLATPYVYNYDLLLLAVAAAFFIRHASRTGWGQWELSGLVPVAFLPFASDPIGRETGIITAPLASVLLFALARRRLHIRLAAMSSSRDSPLSREMGGSAVDSALPKS
jgi:hypothetical protein